MHGRVLEGHREHPLAHRGGLAGRSRGRQAGQVDAGVAPARDAVVELDDGARDAIAPLRAQLAQRRGDVVGAVQVLAPERVRHPRLGEQPPAAGLRPEPEQARVRPVQRDPERQREVALQQARRVGHEVAVRRVGDERAETGEDARALEHLGGQRPRRPVARRHHVQPPPGLARDHPGQQGQVVVDDLLGHRPARHEDHLQARLAQEQEQEQHPLLERLHDRAGLHAVGIDRGHDDDRLARPVPPHLLPDRDQPLLQAGEARAALLLAQVAETRRVRSRHGLPAPTSP